MKKCLVLLNEVIWIVEVFCLMVLLEEKEERKEYDSGWSKAKLPVS